MVFVNVKCSVIRVCAHPEVGSSGKYCLLFITFVPFDFLQIGRIRFAGFVNFILVFLVKQSLFQFYNHVLV